jgi:glutamate synthase domain-containing protein 3
MSRPPKSDFADGDSSLTSLNDFTSSKSRQDADHQFDMSRLSLDQLWTSIHEIPASADEDWVRLHIIGANGQNAALMRLDHPVKIQIDGPLGDYAFAFNAQADIRVTGNVGDGVGEGMRSGAIRVRGNAGVGVGVGMSGGTLAIYGSAGHRCGAGMRGGGIFVRGNVGNETGIGALGGTIVIGGDAGERLGDAMNNVTVFIRGKAKSLADGVAEAPLRKKEQVRLGLLLINASIRGDAKEFRRIVPNAVLEMERSKRGEINPNWR